MSLRYREFDRIRSVLAATDAEEPLTAREILRLLEQHGEDFDSAHRIATILGRQARDGHVEIIEDHPYRYRIPAHHT